jgi:lipoprotein NlpI
VQKEGKEVLEKIKQTTTLAERSEVAQQCVASLKLSIPAVVDREDNKVNAAYAGWPDRLYVVGVDGKIAFKGGPGPRGFKPEEVEAWLKKNLKAAPEKKPIPEQARILYDVLDQAKTASTKGQFDLAITLLNKVVNLDPPLGYAHRAITYEEMGQFAKAAADYSHVITLDPKNAKVYDRRGSVHFKLGSFKESLADFDQYLLMRPEDGPGHWRRGITCYYAGKFEEGKKQFEGYEKVDTNDVENAVWHFLCNARAVGVEKARAALLKIGNDKRVPMMQVYALFAGKIKPEDVLKAAQEGKLSAEPLNRQLFYAHLYLGLYYEVTGDAKRALEHLATAADKHRIDHYMWDVARVHADLLRKAAK